MTGKIKVGVHGAAGRMGRGLVRVLAGDPALELALALESPGHPTLGRDAGDLAGIGNTGVRVTDQWRDPVDVMIDFSVPLAAVKIAQRCAQHITPLIVATTGLTPSQRSEIVACHHTMALLVAPNLSLVVNVLMKLVGDAARILCDKDFDVEIIERHHRFKADAPSGTALRFAEIIEEAMGAAERVHGRSGLTGERPHRQIGIHAVRAGDNVGEHTIIFSTLGETMELVHKGQSRDSYLTGAVLAAKFLVAKGPGLYTMADVLGL